MNNEESAQAAAELTWFKSSYSDNEGGACVEVVAAPGVVRVRDSKDKRGPQLAFTSEAWSDFIALASAM